MRRWQKQKREISHTDDWLMTYADMITLLLCFFAVFIATPAEKAKIVQRIEQPTAVNVTVAGNLPLYGRAHANEPVDHVIGPPPDVTVPIAVVPADQVKEDKPPELQPVFIRSPNVPDIKQKVVNNTTNSSDTLHDIVDHLKTQGPANIEQKGDRITTIDINSAAFFGSGSATISESGKSVLRAVAGNIKSEKFRDYQVTVEGHTDDAPIKTPQFPSNWELSTARASAVVHYFLEQGIPAQRLRAAGYADTFPKVPNRDAAGKPIPANQARNRRVVIKMEKVDREE